MLVLTVRRNNALTLTLPDGRHIRIERGHGDVVKINAPKDVEICRDDAKTKFKEESHV